MRSVIQLSGDRKAIVEIPYSRLVPQGKQKPTSDHQCCQSKIVLGGGSKGKVNVELKRMVEQMEQAYDRDVKELQAKIKQLQGENASILLEHSKETVRINYQFSNRKEIYEKQVSTLKQLCIKKDQEAAKMLQQKELILRSKINEFKQSEYISKISDLEHVLRLKDLQIREVFSKLEVSQLERARLEEKVETAKLQRLRVEEQLQSNRYKLESQISKLSMELSQTAKRYASDQSSLTFASKIRQEDSQKLISQLKYQLQLSDRALKECEFTNESKTKQISSLNQAVSELQVKVSNLELQIVSHKDKTSNLQQENLILSQKLNRSSEAVAYLDEQKGRLLLEIGDRLAEIDKLKIDLSTKQKVYEVKIERVIDGKSQIDQLQAAVFELEQQMKLLGQDKDFLSEDLKKKQREYDELAIDKMKLQAEITALKAYISKREGSFRWTVERQIEKDIAVTDQKPQLYKVSQINEYSREAKETNRVISEEIAMKMQANLFGSFPQQVTLQPNM